MKNKIKELQTKFPAFDEAMLKISNTANFYVASQTDEHAVRLCMAYAFEAGYRKAVEDQAGYLVKYRESYAEDICPPRDITVFDPAARTVIAFHMGRFLIDNMIKDNAKRLEEKE